ncbi:MAG TPA: hypothetical protein VFT74_16220, partial [Isosphaeraceae bacterium]|nr:hypothetical protein [Isosphaeraceae bacterium]
ALGVGLGYALGHAIVAKPAFPPGEVTSRIPYLAVAAAVVSVGQGGGLGRFLRALALASVVYLVMLSPILSRGEHSNLALIGLAGTALTALISAGNVAALDEPGRRIELHWALAVLSFGAGFVFLMARSVVLAQLSLVLAASLVGAWRASAPGVSLVALTVLSALVIESVFYAFLPASGALLIAGAPALNWVTRLGPLARLGTKGRAILTVTLIAATVALALFVVI